MSTVQSILAACPELRGLDDAGREALGRHAVLHRVQTGERLWSQGAAADTVIVLAGGLVRISTQGEDGGLLTSALLCGHHLIGEAEIFAGVSLRFNEAVALSPQAVVSLPGAALSDCLDAHPALMRQWLHASNQRFILALTHARGVALRTAEERLHALIGMLLRYNQALITGDTVSLPFSQEDLAGMAALTRQAACKVIADWRARGLAESGYQRLDILRVAHFRD